MDQNSKKISGYEKYNSIFEKIKEMCDEKHYQGRIGDYGESEYMSEDCTLMGYKYYELDNGLNVYIKKDGEDIIICEYPKNEMLTRNVDSITTFSKYEQPSNTITLNMSGYGWITYGPEGDDSTCLPTNATRDESIEKYIDKENIDTNIMYILKKALDNVEDLKMQKVYENALEFFSDVERNALPELDFDDYEEQEEWEEKYPEAFWDPYDDTELYEEYKQREREENEDLQHPEETERNSQGDIDKLPLDELQKYLKNLQDENRKNEKTLKMEEERYRGEIIKKIKKEIEIEKQRGKEIEKRLNEIREKSAHNR